jgi:hypothetical protein
MRLRLDRELAQSMFRGVGLAAICVLLIASVAVPAAKAFPAPLSSAWMQFQSAEATRVSKSVRLAGSYRVEGRNVDGSRYAGRVTISQDDKTFRFRWEIGRDVYLGEGALNGDVLTVYWGQPEPVIYILRADGSLQGTWAAGRASEVLTPLR